MLGASHTGAGRGGALTQSDRTGALSCNYQGLQNPGDPRWTELRCSGAVWLGVRVCLLFDVLAGQGLIHPCRAGLMGLS